jgi:orotidine-5'-phosphate decarboxylase
MMRAASRARKDSNNKNTKIIAVTMLTSLDDNDLKEVGFSITSNELVLSLAKLAKDSGLDGIVCSAREISTIREAIGKDFLLVVPGIRPEDNKLNDQKRTMTPKGAISEGADLLVIGRPITQSDDQVSALMNILEQIK